MAAEGLVTFDELKEKLRTLEETRQLAEQELKALKVCQARLRELEPGKDIFFEIYAHIVPETMSTSPRRAAPHL